MITISNNPATDQPADTRRIRQEIAIVLVVTFGLSGMRAALRLLSDLMQPVPLNQQQTTLAEHQSDTSWIDLAMQLCSSAMLFSWGFLALYLLRESIFSRWQPKAILEGAGWCSTFPRCILGSASRWFPARLTTPGGRSSCCSSGRRRTLLAKKSLW